jgi:RNA polymerase sigma factor (sigma-70 family)
MTHMATGSVVRQLESLFTGGLVAGLSDRQLLERYTAGGHDPVGEAAFAALVARHGPMVLSVCRQLLGDVQHAEDAFQAVFLVLAQKAGSIRDPDLLGNWLYGVAVRTAQCARQQVARRQRREESDTMSGPGTGWCRSAEPTAPPADHPAIDREQAEALHVEVDRLPHAFRLPVVLCYFEGLTIDEAARRLQCPSGTLHSRLARAREKLRRSLLRRGFVLSTTAMAAALTPRSASASVSSLPCDFTTRAAIAFAARHAAVGGVLKTPAAALAQEVLRTMLVHKIKAVALSLALLVTLATGVGYYSLIALAQSREGEPPGEPVAQQAPTEPRPPNPTRPSPAPGRMFVVGRVLDPAGQPVPNATTMVYARSKALASFSIPSRMSPIPIGDARTDRSGRFRIDAPRTSSSRHDKFGTVAIAPGYGAGWIELDPDADQPTVDITLGPEYVVQGRLFDVQGRTIRGITITVGSMARVIQRGGGPAGLDRLEGIGFSASQAKDLPAWPQPATTDAEGRFSLHGVGRGLRVSLTVDDPRFASQQIRLDTDGTADSKPLTMALEPARVITGRVTYADTAQPVPHALIEVQSHKPNVNMFPVTEFETDAQGRFRMNPTSGDVYNISVWPAAGQPYLKVSKRLDWPKGAVEQSLDLALPRGVLIHGKVTEEGSGQPIAGATVRFLAHAEERDNAGSRSGSTVVDTAADGSFQFGALPHPGYLFIIGPSDDYVFQEIGQRMVRQGQPGGQRYYAHAYIRLDLKPGDGDRDVNVVLRRGMTVRGQIVGPDNQPVQNTSMISRIILGPRGAWRIWRGNDHGMARNGGFEIHGVNPDVETPVHFFEPKRKLGVTVRFSGTSTTRGPITVRLEPCGTARARLVDPQGKPVARSRDTYGSHMTMIAVTPGPHRLTQGGAEQALLAADLDSLARIDPVHYGKELVSDDNGVLNLPALIPGATYRIYDDTLSESTGPRLRKEFTVKPGETLDLGDIRIEKPQ